MSSLATCLARLAPISPHSLEAFIFFGGMTKAGELLMKPIKEGYNNHVLSIFKGKAKFLFSSLEGSSAAVLGASAIGWDL